MDLMRIRVKLVVDENLLVLSFDHVPRGTDYPLDEILAGVFRILEDDDVSLAGITDLDD
jgi:hypothetical protein